MIRLPILTTTFDAGDLSPEYAGVQVVMRLNPPILDYKAPWDGVEDQAKREDMMQAEPWAAAFYVRRAMSFVSVVIPGKFTDDNLMEVVEINQARDLWVLESRSDFDPVITLWASGQWADKRDARIRGELGN